MKIIVFKSSYDVYGGAEVLASYVSKAVGSKVYSLVTDKRNELGFIDISKDLPLIARTLRKKREFDYLSWSCIDITKYGDFDVVVTLGETARALITPDDVVHVHYLTSPMRWLYDLWHYSRKSKRNFLKREILLPILAEFYRVWDNTIDKRVDYYITLSPVIQRRLWKYLKRDSIVLYPPIEFNKYKCKESEDFYLFVGRLWPEKRPEEAILGCIKANKKIKVIGRGDLEEKLRKKYEKYSNVEFLGFVSEKEKIDLLAHCKAVIYPCLAEDFGIVPIEAFASGKPVIADCTGFPPYVVNDERGVITDCSNPENIAKAIKIIEGKEYNQEKIREFAKRFDFSAFKEQLINQLEEWYNEFTQK